MKTKTKTKSRRRLKVEGYWQPDANLRLLFAVAQFTNQAQDLASELWHDGSVSRERAEWLHDLTRRAQMAASDLLALVQCEEMREGR